MKDLTAGIQFARYVPIDNSRYVDIYNPENPFSEYNFPTIYNTERALRVPVKEENSRVKEEPIVEKSPQISTKTNIAEYVPKTYKGLSEFNKAYNEVEKYNPDAKKYRSFLTMMAEKESGFNSSIQNKSGAPAYGYFQFMQDGKRYNNIKHYANTDTDTFRNNPKIQIESAIKLAQDFEKGFNEKDLELAKSKGYNIWGLLGGAWLAGNGGVRKYLQGLGNPSDKHWSKEGKGTDVSSRINLFNKIDKKTKGGKIESDTTGRINKPEIPQRIRKATPAERTKSIVDIYGETPIATIQQDDRGFDNSMNVMFKGIVDYKIMADWLTKHAPIITVPLINKFNYDNTAR